MTLLLICGLLFAALGAAIKGGYELGKAGK